MSFLSRLGFRYKVLIGFLLPAFLIGFLAVFTYIQVQSLLDSSNWVRHTHEVIAKARLLEKLVVDMETGQRGFLITGKESFLEPYHIAQEHWLTELENLKTLVSDNPPQVAKAVEVGETAHFWIELVLKPEIELRRQVDTSAALDIEEVVFLVEAETGKQVMGDIRQGLASFIAEEERLMALRDHAASDSANFTIWIGTVALPLLEVVFLVIASLLLLKSVLTPLKRLTVAARKVSKGDLSVRLEEGVRDEIGTLARTFNKMTESLKEARDETHRSDQEVKAAYSQLERKAAELEQSNKYKSEFLANMSHEIRTPMNGVLGMLGLLSKFDLPDQARHYCRLALSSADSLLVVINDILDFSKIDAGKLDIENIDFNLAAQLSELSQTIGFRAQEKGLEFVLDLSELNVSMVKGDPGRLRQILTNLINNSIKFTKDGEILVKAKIVATEDSALCLSCSVKDTGIGISRDQQTRLFDAFTQEDASTTRKYGGTGLGLAIVRQLCELMGGGISVRSEKGEGSEFTFHIMLEASDVDETQCVRKGIEGQKIFIVDDNETNRIVLRGQLESWGVEVTEAEDGPSALALLDAMEEVEFSAAILDMQMPEMNGAELGQKIRSDKRFDHMLLIMMTSMSDRGDIEAFSNIGFSGYFPKPVTPSDLYDGLTKVLDDGFARQSEPMVSNYTVKRAVARRGIKNGRILLVEDNAINQMVAEGILNSMGLTSDFADDGQQALEALSDESVSPPYTLVLMDCQMPVMDGYEATKAIRSGKSGVLDPDITIIAMTANAMKGDREKCLSVGMNDYLPKPIDAEELEGKLAEWL